MNEVYFNEYVSLLERIFSFAYKNEYSLGMLEKEISRSSFFQQVEKRSGVLTPLVSDISLIRKLFGVSIDNLDDLPTYKECAWAAESYCHIQKETRLSFEAIFLYIPIKKMYDYYPLYHEMDFFHIMNEFSRLYFKTSVLSILIDRREIRMRVISKELGISYASLFSYKKRRRDIKKMSAEIACGLANIFNVRIETLLEYFI